MAEEVLRPASVLLRRSTLRRSSPLLVAVPLPLLGGPKGGGCIPPFPFAGWDQRLCSTPPMQRRIFVPHGQWGEVPAVRSAQRLQQPAI